MQLAVVRAHKSALRLVFCLRRKRPLMELLVLLEASLIVLVVAFLVCMVEMRRLLLQQHRTTVVVRFFEGLHAGRSMKLARFL